MLVTYTTAARPHITQRNSGEGITKKLSLTLRGLPFLRKVGRDTWKATLIPLALCQTEKTAQDPESQVLGPF